MSVFQPGGWAMTPTQVREFKDALNLVSGDMARKHKVIVMPPPALPFHDLRHLAETSPVIRACIELRKQEVAWAEWDITPTAQATKAMRGDHKALRGFGERRHEAIQFFRHPDPDYGTFAEWTRAILEEVLVLNACAIYQHAARGKDAGLLGSNLASLNVMNTEAVMPPPQAVLHPAPLAAAIRFNDDGEFDLAETEAAAPASFGVPVAALGMTGQPEEQSLRPLAAELRTWLKVMINSILHATPGGHCLKWTWAETASR